MDLLVLMVKGSLMVALVTFSFLEFLAILMQFGMLAYKKRKYKNCGTLGYYVTVRGQFEDFVQNMWICLTFSAIPAAAVWLAIYIYTFYFL